MRAIMDHVLAMVLFVAMLVEFLLVKSAGTSTFFLLVSSVWSMCWLASSSASAARSRQVEFDKDRDSETTLQDAGGR